MSAQVWERGEGPLQDGIKLKRWGVRKRDSKKGQIDRNIE
jgi:hypothetical protein